MLRPAQKRDATGPDIIYVCHASSIAGEEHVYSTQSKNCKGLSRRGVEETEELPDKLAKSLKDKKFRVFSSDYPRALETAIPFSEYVQSSCEVRDGLNDINLPSLDGVLENVDFDREMTADINRHTTSDEEHVSWCVGFNHYCQSDLPEEERRGIDEIDKEVRDGIGRRLALLGDSDEGMAEFVNRTIKGYCTLLEGATKEGLDAVVVFSHPTQCRILANIWSGCPPLEIRMVRPCEIFSKNMLNASLSRDVPEYWFGTTRAYLSANVQIKQHNPNVIEGIGQTVNTLPKFFNTRFEAVTTDSDTVRISFADWEVGNPVSYTDIRQGIIALASKYSVKQDQQGDDQYVFTTGPGASLISMNEGYPGCQPGLMIYSRIEDGELNPIHTETYTGIVNSSDFGSLIALSDANKRESVTFGGVFQTYTVFMNEKRAME